MSAARVAVEAVSCMTPTQSEGRPSISRSHSITRSSSSSAAGEVCQIMHCAPMVAVNISASTEGALFPVGK